MISKRLRRLDVKSEFFSLRVGTHTKRTTGLNYEFSIAGVMEELKLRRRTYLGYHWENTKFFHTRSASFERTEYGNFLFLGLIS